MSNQETETYLAKKLEGKLFAHIYMLHFGNTYTFCKDYYTVQNGIVLMVNDQKTQPSGDTLTSISVDCKELGKYDPAKNYRRIMKDSTYKAINNFLKKKSQ